MAHKVLPVGRIPEVSVERRKFFLNIYRNLELFADIIEENGPSLEFIKVGRETIYFGELMNGFGELTFLEKVVFRAVCFEERSYAEIRDALFPSASNTNVVALKFTSAMNKLILFYDNAVLMKSCLKENKKVKEIKRKKIVDDRMEQFNKEQEEKSIELRGVLV